MSTMIVFLCPTNGHEVQSGVLTDAWSFREIRDRAVTMTCPECGQKHTWRCNEGKLSLHEEVALPKFVRIH
jgi:predicted RNA-binding Zn-ribbon protein involved in translation (DUF1610 family)